VGELTPANAALIAVASINRFKLLILIA